MAIHRVQTQKLAEAINNGLELLPLPIRRVVENVPVFEGDVIFSGVHHWDKSRDRAHCYFEKGAGNCGIAFPYLPEPRTVVHEYAHAFLDKLYSRHGRHKKIKLPTIATKDSYAKKNYHEAWAWAFECLYVPNNTLRIRPEDVLKPSNEEIRTWLNNYIITNERNYK